MLDKVKKIISEYQDFNIEDINENTNLLTDVGLTSFDVVSLVCIFEKEFNIEIPDRKIRELKTIKDVVDYIEKNKRMV